MFTSNSIFDLLLYSTDTDDLTARRHFFYIFNPQCTVKIHKEMGLPNWRVQKGSSFSHLHLIIIMQLAVSVSCLVCLLIYDLNALAREFSTSKVSIYA